MSGKESKATPMISVVIPVYKTEKYLRETVDSVKAQTFEDWEIVLVDDGSPDNAPAICDELADADPRISVIHKPNGGLSSARNAGIDAAAGRFVLFLDSDDILEPNALELGLGAMKQTVDAVIPLRYVKFFDSGEPRVECLHIPKGELTDDPREFAVKVLMGRGRAWRASSNLYRLSLIREYGVRFPEGYTAEDIVFNLRYYAHARSIAFVDSPTLRYRKRDGSITGTFDPAFMDIIDYIDRQARAFVSENCPESCMGYTDSLYLRNAVMYACQAASAPGGGKRVREILSAERVKKAASGYVSYPYFDGKVKRLFIRLVFILQRLRLRGLSYLAVLAASKIIG